MNIQDVNILIEKGKLQDDYDWANLSFRPLREETICEFQDKLDWNIILRNQKISCECFIKCYNSIRKSITCEASVIKFVENNGYIKRQFLVDYIFSIISSPSSYNWRSILRNNYYHVFTPYARNFGLEQYY